MKKINSILCRTAFLWPLALVTLFALWNRPIGEAEREALSERIKALEIAAGIS